MLEVDTYISCDVLCNDIIQVIPDCDLNGINYFESMLSGDYW